MQEEVNIINPNDTTEIIYLDDILDKKLPIHSVINPENFMHLGNDVRRLEREYYSKGLNPPITSEWLKYRDQMIRIR